MDSMDTIYQKYAKQVYKYLMSLSGNEDLAEELTQETFYQAIKSIHRYDETSCKISTWLCAIAKNQYLSYTRKNPAMENIEDMSEGANAHGSAESEVFQSLGRVEILKLIHSCEEPYKEVLYLRLFEDLSFRDIGEITGKTENWARVTFYRGKEMLRKEMSK